MIKELPFGHHLRVATEEDSSAVYGMVDEAIKDSYLPNALHSYKDIQEHIEGFIKDKNNLVLLLCDEHGAHLGILAASKIGGPFLFHPFAIEVVWWVDPVARKGRNPFRMIEAYEYWAKTQGCKYIKLSLLTKWSRKESKRLNKIYRKKGFHPFETAYFKELG